MEFLFLATNSRMTVVQTQPPIQWVPWVLSPREGGSAVEAWSYFLDHVLKLRMCGALTPHPSYQMLYWYLYAGKCKVKIAPMLNKAPCHEEVRGSGSIGTCILNLSSRWRWVVRFMSWPLYLRERAPGTHWIGGWVRPIDGLDTVVRRKIPYPCWELKHSWPAHSLLYQLSYPSSWRDWGKVWNIYQDSKSNLRPFEYEAIC